jgi:hypothetical protein
LCNASNIQSQIIHAGIVQYNYGPFLPLSGSDYGVQSVQSVQFTAAGGLACSGNLVLCRPLCSFPLAQQGVSGSREYLFAFPKPPLVYDGACLAAIICPGGATAANTNFVGALDIAWY